MTPHRIAFVGLGHMGSHMCRHVVAAGHDVSAFDLDRKAVTAAARAGARGARSLADCLDGAEILICSLPGPPQVRAVLCGDGGAIAQLAPGSLVIDMSTSSQEVGREALKLARARRIEFVDAPVAGQTIGANAGTLSIYAGGSKRAYARARPVLEAMGEPSRIFHTGVSGTGYAVKLMLNLMWFMHMIATAEALTIGVRAGVEIDTLRKSLLNSQASSVFLEQDILMVLDSADYDEGFAMKLVNKDLALAIDLARDASVPAEMAALVEQLNRRARLVYGDEAGEMSAIRLYEDAVGVQLRSNA